MAITIIQRYLYTQLKQDINFTIARSQLMDFV